MEKQNRGNETSFPDTGTSVPHNVPKPGLRKWDGKPGGSRRACWTEAERVPGQEAPGGLDRAAGASQAGTNVTASV